MVPPPPTQPCLGIVDNAGSQLHRNVVFHLVVLVVEVQEGLGLWTNQKGSMDNTNCRHYHPEALFPLLLSHPRATSSPLQHGQSQATLIPMSLALLEGRTLQNTLIVPAIFPAVTGSYSRGSWEAGKKSPIGDFFPGGNYTGGLHYKWMPDTAANLYFGNPFIDWMTHVPQDALTKQA
jgi:hypothetical protein